MSFVLKLSGNTSVLKANYFPPITLVKANNFPLFLFDEIRLEINGKVIDSIKNFWVHAIMKGVLFTSKKAENYTSLHGWYKNDHLLEKGQIFSYYIPLKMYL